MKQIRVVSDTNLELIEEAFSTQNIDNHILNFLPFSRPSVLNVRSNKNTDVVYDSIFTIFLPSMWHLFSKTIANISMPADATKIDTIIHSYIEELNNVLLLSDNNLVVLPRIPDSTLFGLSLGGAEYKTFISWKRVWLNFVQNLSAAFEHHANVVLVDAVDLFGSLEVQDKKIRQRIFFELMAEHTFEEAVCFAKNSISAVQSYCEVSNIKCICLDLDDTLWGGILGDEGVSGITLGGLSAKGRAFVEVQKFFKSLKNRGYFLAIVSKNYLDIVIEALDHHPDMVLGKDDFQIIYCGWGAKSERIKSVAEALNIGEDAIVFFDDSPFERSEVKKNAPHVKVPDYSSNPLECLSRLYISKLFETATVSDDDFLRNSGVIISRPNREGDNFLVTQKKARSNVNSDNDGLSTAFEEVSTRNFPRLLQLINKTNQFNLMGNRYTEKSLSDLLMKCEIALVGNVKDEFANYGLTVVIIGQIKGAAINIQEMVMSCRVFGRGVEMAAVEEAIRVGLTVNSKINEVRFVGNRTQKNRPLIEFLDNIALEKGYFLMHREIEFRIEFRDQD